MKGDKKRWCGEVLRGLHKRMLTESGSGEAFRPTPFTRAIPFFQEYERSTRNYSSKNSKSESRS